MNVLERIEAEIVCNSADYYKLRHLVHFLEGYRSYVLQDDGNPYSIGSARHFSFEAGYRLAEEDRIRIL